MALRLRRGTNAERLTVTPESGEIIYVTDSKKLYVGDGSTVGGNLVSGVNNIIDDATPQLGGNLDLNSNDIIGNGNININGNITASGNITATGTISLGDDPSDSISVGGSLTTDLIPELDEDIDLGTPTKRFRNLWVSTATVTGAITADSFQGQLLADDSTIAFIPETSEFIGQFTGSLTGDINGSLFSDDSTLIVDGINRQIFVSQVETSEIVSPTSDINYTEEDARAIFNLKRRQAGDLRLSAGFQQAYGQIRFERDDDNGVNVGVSISGGGNGFYIDPEGDGTYPESAGFTMLNDGDVGLGTYTPNAKLDVRGSAIVTGSVTSTFIGSLFADNSTQVVDNNGNITNLSFTGQTGNTPGDTVSVDSWLEVTVNGVTKYIPLYA